MDDALGSEQGSGMKAPSLLKVEQRRGWMEGLWNGWKEERKPIQKSKSLDENEILKL